MIGLASGADGYQRVALLAFLISHHEDFPCFCLPPRADPVLRPPRCLSPFQPALAPSPRQCIPTHCHCQGFGAAPVGPGHAAQGDRVVPPWDQPLEEVLDLPSAESVPPGQCAVPGIPQPQLALVLLSRDTAPGDEHRIVPFSHRREIFGNCGGYNENHTRGELVA